METIDHLAITKALEQLGNTSTAVAASLTNKGIKGFQNCTDDCPLAVYLAEQFPGLATVVSQYVTVGRQSADHTEATLWFMHDFDGGRYPELTQMNDRLMTRGELMATEVGRALRFGYATLTVPGVRPHEAVQAAVSVLRDHDRTLTSRFGPCWAEEARERGLL